MCRTLTLPVQYRGLSGSAFSGRNFRNSRQVQSINPQADQPAKSSGIHLTSCALYLNLVMMKEWSLWKGNLTAKRKVKPVLIPVLVLMQFESAWAKKIQKILCSDTDGRVLKNESAHKEMNQHTKNENISSLLTIEYLNTWIESFRSIHDTHYVRKNTLQGCLAIPLLSGTLWPRSKVLRTDRSGTSAILFDLVLVRNADPSAC